MNLTSNDTQKRPKPHTSVTEGDCVIDWIDFQAHKITKPLRDGEEGRVLILPFYCYKRPFPVRE